MITVVIPHRPNESTDLTVNSLLRQTIPTKIIIVEDEAGNANWARNEGFKSVESEFVLFSDSDIQWEPDALENLHRTLVEAEHASYSYGWYEMEGRVIGQREFDASALKQQNYISTMSLIRSGDFPGFDLWIKRLQDWDLWLTMLARGKVGVYCNRKIFTTFKRSSGITYGGGIDYAKAKKILMIKHGYF
jgi:glycosyltransferase involved in cell wall biosynthesis